MHDIEPHFQWREKYIASEDENTPFYGQSYSEFSFTNKVYNYFVHPQWDSIGSETLYVKLIYADYIEGSAIIQLIGEWNDCLHNDIMLLKRNLIDLLIKEDISKFVILCDHVMSFHASDDAYYEEWHEEVSEEFGWVSFINVRDHIEQEMLSANIQYYIKLGEVYNEFFWQKLKPEILIREVEHRIHNHQKALY